MRVFRNEPAPQPQRHSGFIPTVRNGKWKSRQGFGFVNFGRQNTINYDTLGVSTSMHSRPIPLGVIRRIARRSSLAQAYLDRMRIGVIGSYGPTPTWSMVENEQSKARLTELWEMFAENPSVAGQMSWAQMLRSMVASRAIDGRVYGIIRRNRDYEAGVALMPLTRDWLQDFLFEDRYTHGGATYKVVRGIARGDSGRVKGYIFYPDGTPSQVQASNSSLFSGGHIMPRRGSRGTGRVFIPTEMVCDYNTISEADDIDGSVSNLLPMIYTLLQITKLDEATAVTMYAASIKMGFIKQRDGGVTVKSMEEMSERWDDYEPPDQLEANEIELLPPGYDFDKFDPSSPNIDMTRYRNHLIKNAASGLGFDNASISGDLEAVNYSSLRHGALLAQDTYRAAQVDLDRSICRQLMPRLIDSWDLMGLVKLSMRDKAAAMKTTWRHRSWPWVDPLKDAQAARILMRMGAMSPQELCAERGIDYNDMVKDIAEFLNLLKEAGLTPDDLGAISGDAMKKPGPDEQEDGEGGEKSKKDD